MGSGRMAGGFDGWLGAAPAGGGGGSGVQSVSGTNGITVDNADPQNPIVKLTNFPSITGYLSEIYAQGLADDPVADNTLVGTYFSTYFDQATDAAAVGVSVIETFTSDGSDFDRHPALFLERKFSTVTIPGLVALYSQRYTGSGAKVQGGVQMRARLVDDDGAATFWTQSLSMSTPVIAQWYSPALAGDRVGQVNWDIVNITGGTTPIYFNADGVHYRTALLPSGGAPYRNKVQQIAMLGYAGSFNAPADGSAVSYTVTGPAVSAGDGPEIATWDVVMDAQNLGSAQIEGHHEFWASTLLGGRTRTLQIFPQNSVRLSSLSTSAISYNTTAQRLQLSNNGSSYSNVLVSTDIAPASGALLVTDVPSASQNFKTATTFTVVPTVARTFLPVAAYVEFTTVTALTVGPTLKLGNNGAHDNVAPALAVANTVVTGSAPPFVMASDVATIDLTSTGIICELTVNATATTATGRVHVLGVYIT